MWWIRPTGSWPLPENCFRSATARQGGQIDGPGPGASAATLPDAPGRSSPSVSPGDLTPLEPPNRVGRRSRPPSRPRWPAGYLFRQTADADGWQRHAVASGAMAGAAPCRGPDRHWNPTTGLGAGTGATGRRCLISSAGTGSTCCRIVRLALPGMVDWSTSDHGCCAGSERQLRPGCSAGAARCGADRRPTASAGLITLTAQIASAHCANNTIEAEALPGLIHQIYQALALWARLQRR